MDGCFHLSPDRVSIYPLSPSTHTGLEAMPLVYLEMLILLCCPNSDDLLAPVMSLIWARREVTGRLVLIHTGLVSLGQLITSV